ncbi:MAG: hypothetical protein IM638_14315 [Bacteroidetes bacterium]|nr:hypothetical protein [Bacteroidota bacterium]
MKKLTSFFFFLPLSLFSQTEIPQRLVYSVFGGTNFSTIRVFDLLGHQNPYVKQDLYYGNTPLLNPYEEHDFTYTTRVENVKYSPGFQFGLRLSNPGKFVSVAAQLAFSQLNLNYDYTRTWFRGHHGTMQGAKWKNNWLDFSIMAQFTCGTGSRFKFFAGLGVSKCVSSKNEGWMNDHQYYTYLTNNGGGTINSTAEYQLTTKIDNLNYSTNIGIEAPLTKKDNVPLYASLMWNKGFSNLAFEHNVSQSNLQLNIIYYFFL